MPSERLCLLQVHAHPDDEASKGAGTTAEYAAEGVRNVLVCCTGGEAGDILNPAVEHPGSRAKRCTTCAWPSCARACDVLGYDVAAPARLPRQRDARHRDERAARQLRQRAARRSGRAARAHHPRRAAAGDHHLPRRAELLSASRPHPCARDLGSGVRRWPAIPRRIPTPAPRGSRRSCTTSAWSIARVKALHEAYLDRGEESPYTSWFERGFDTDRKDDFTTLIDVGDYLAQAPRGAARAPHAGRSRRASGCACPTTSSARSSRGRSSSLARSLVDNARRREGEFEDDLFAGIRAPARVRPCLS